MEYKVNEELLKFMNLAGVLQRDVAAYMGIHPSTLCKQLQKELTPENRKKIVIAIKEICIEKEVKALDQ